MVGGGPAGCLMALHLARRGYDVKVYELLDDPRECGVASSKSINLTLAARGMAALEEVGLLEQALAASVPLRGRLVHGADGEAFHPYGARPDELLYSVRRNQLMVTLLEATAEHPNVEITFNTRCVRVDRDRAEVSFQDEVSGREWSERFDHLVGADGVYSAVRQHMQRGLGAEYRQDSLTWGYKELVIPAGAVTTSELAYDCLHSWPRGDRLLLAIPNADGSFVCTCVLPFHGEDSFDTVQSRVEVELFIRRTFGATVASIPGVVDQFCSKPTSAFTTIRTAPWQYKGKVVLIGDACHAIYPFYGQGLNAALEDCRVFNELLDAEGGDWRSACSAFEAYRKPGTDVLADLSEENFAELRSTAGSGLLAARKQVTMALARFLPDRWTPLYKLVSHTTVPIDEALRRAKSQERIARLLGMDAVVAVVAAWSAIGGAATGVGSRRRDADVPHLTRLQGLGQAEEELVEVEAREGVAK
ncbi:MAG TPA: NAD(P)/FAD-dependent oxidoreductase [Acidimicrobiales bacterium]|nr:NAD(P)/FAD-dependent oxidoreductase [Acidimicrobiales bacterium]